MKILLMSAFGYNDSDISNGFSLSEVERFIEKPVSLHKLNEIVHKYSSTSTKQPYYIFPDTKKQQSNFNYTSS